MSVRPSVCLSVPCLCVCLFSRFAPLLVESAVSQPDKASLWITRSPERGSDLPGPGTASAAPSWRPASWGAVCQQLLSPRVVSIDLPSHSLNIERDKERAGRCAYLHWWGWSRLRPALAIWAVCFIPTVLTLTHAHTLNIHTYTRAHTHLYTCAHTQTHTHTHTHTQTNTDRPTNTEKNVWPYMSAEAAVLASFLPKMAPMEYIREQESESSGYCISHWHFRRLR